MNELFTYPFFSGLILALILPLLGNLLRLRGESLATLGLAHMAAAGTLLGMAVGLPAMLGAPIGAVTATVLKNINKSRGDSAFALMILGGWAATLLIAANSHLGESLAHALVDGQLFFTSISELAIAVVLLIISGPLLKLLSAKLILARLYPENEIANNLPAWRWHWGFDLLAAIVIAVATSTIGLMAAFSLIFVPAFFAFRYAVNWLNAQIISLIFSLIAYLLAFFLAIKFDQPFGAIITSINLILLFIASVLYRLLNK